MFRHNPPLATIPRPTPPVITPHPIPPITPPAPPSLPKPSSAYGRMFRPTGYAGIDAVVFDPLSAARPVEPPFAPEAFQRPAPTPEMFTQIPAGLAGPIFPAPGWHFGPPVHLGVKAGYNTSKIDWTKVPESEYSGAGANVAMIGLGGLLLLGLPIASSIAFGRKYGGPGYVLGFFVPGAIGAGIAALNRAGKASAPATPPDMGAVHYGDPDSSPMNWTPILGVGALVAAAYYLSRKDKESKQAERLLSVL